jgi:exopolysaccharide production protein ExoZ
VTTKKIENIQALRGIAVLLVVFSHISILEGIYAQYDFILPDFFIIGFSGVDLFFVISGFVMVNVTRESFQNRGETQRFLYHRLTRIYPLYWFYSSLILFVWIIHPAWVNSDQGSQINVIASFLLLPQNILPLVSVGWTLVHEMYFYFIFAILLLLPKKNFLLGVIFWGCIVAIVNICFSDISNPFLLVYSHPLTIEFIIGCLIALLYYRKPLPGNAFLIASASLISWVLGYYLFRKLSGNLIPLGWEKVLIFGVPSALAVYAALLFESKNAALLPRWIRSIGDASYSIYLSHILVLHAIGKIWRTIATEGYIDNILMMIAMITAVIITGFLSYNLIERKMLNITRNVEKKYLRSYFLKQ